MMAHRYENAPAKGTNQGVKYGVREATLWICLLCEVYWAFVLPA